MAKAERETNHGTGDGENTGRETAWRRHVRNLLEERGHWVSIAAVTDRIVAHEASTSGETLSRETVHGRLYYHTLPAMTDEGVVAFDSHRGIVEPIGDEASTASENAGVGGVRRREWYELSVCLIGFTVLGLIELRVAPFASLPLAGLLAVCIVAFALPSAVSLGRLLVE